MSAGSVVNVEEVRAGSELLADASSGAGTITVEDPTDFQPDGGELLIGVDEEAYSAVSDAGVITLDGTLGSSYLAGEPVFVLPGTIERFAHVQLEDQEEALLARVPHSLYPLLPVGIRDPDADELELVEVDRDPGGELIVSDVLEREPVLDGSVIPPETLPDPVLTDGSPPASSPAPTVLGGVLSLFVQWLAIANADPVTYEIHVSTTSGFTPSAGTKAGESRGTFFVIRTLPGSGVPPVYGVTYFVKIVAYDDDGAAPASTEDSAAPEEGNDDAIIASMIAANAVLAEHLQAVMVLSSTIVAGTENAGRVELGIATDDAMGGMIGIHAMAHDGMTVTFMVDAETGEVYVKGHFDFGVNWFDPALPASRLMTDNIIELFTQPTGSFQSPGVVQSIGGRTPVGGASTVSAAWPAMTQTNSLLIAAVMLADPDGTPPTPTTPGGWTQIANVTRAAGRLVVYKIENAAARGGAVTVTLGDTVDATLQLVELAGLGVQDVAVVTANANSAAPAVGPSATTTQTHERWIAILGNYDYATDGASVPTSPSDSFTLTRSESAPVAVGLVPKVKQSIFAKNVTATGTASMSATLAEAEDWMMALVTFKAKAAGVEAPDSGYVRLYGAYDDDEVLLRTISENGTDRMLMLSPPYVATATPWTKAANTTLERTLMESANNLPTLVGPALPETVGAVFRVRVAGSYDHGSAGGSLTFRLRADSTLLDSFGIAAPGSNQTGQGFELAATVVVKVGGATGKLAGQFSRFANGAGTPYIARGFSEVTVNLTAVVRLDVTAQFGNAVAANGITVEHVIVERLA